MAGHLVRSVSGTPLLHVHGATMDFSTTTDFTKGSKPRWAPVSSGQYLSTSSAFCTKDLWMGSSNRYSFFGLSPPRSLAPSVGTPPSETAAGATAGTTATSFVFCKFSRTFSLFSVELAYSSNLTTRPAYSFMKHVLPSQKHLCTALQSASPMSRHAFSKQWSPTHVHFLFASAEPVQSLKFCLSRQNGVCSCIMHSSLSHWQWPGALHSASLLRVPHSSG
mmetsp:Transcript_299/g.1058  ORF Transcript_299/g.1058 Transcript_299/m.1058 type:complete len:221 (+) Transcript_299:2114-2776(+)